MILRTIRSNIDHFKRSVVPATPARNSHEVAHRNVDRETLIKNIQVAYRVSAWEAEAQVDAAESRSKKMKKASIFVRA